MTATEIERLVVRITADGTMFFSTMKRVESSVLRLSRTFENALNRMKRAAAQKQAAAERSIARAIAGYERQANAEVKAAERVAEKAKKAEDRLADARFRIWARIVAQDERSQQMIADARFRIWARIVAQQERDAAKTAAATARAAAAQRRQFDAALRSLDRYNAALQRSKAKEEALAQRTAARVQAIQQRQFAASLRALERYNAANERAKQKEIKAQERATAAALRARARETVAAVRAAERQAQAVHRAAQREAAARARAVQASVRSVEDGFSRMESVGRRMAIMITAPIILAMRRIMQQFTAFDRAVTEASARIGGVSPAVRSRMEGMLTGLSTSGEVSFSPTELAKGLEDLAAAGLGAERAMAVLPTTARFAQAGAMDMAEATEHLVSAATALGTVNENMAPAEYARNLQGISDRIVLAANASQASVESLSTSLVTDAAASANIYGLSMNEVIAVLATYAQAGHTGERAGHMFGRGVRLLTAAFVRNQRAWQDLNIDLTDGMGGWVNFPEQVRRVADALRNLDDVSKATALQRLGIATLSQKAIAPLLNRSDFTQSILARLNNSEGRDGATAATAAIQMQAFGNQVQLAWNRLAAFANVVGSRVGPTLLYLAQTLAAVGEGFIKLSPQTQGLILVVVALVAAIGPLLITIGILGSVLGSARVAILAMTAAMRAMTVATFTGQSAFGVFAGSVGAALAVITLLARGVVQAEGSVRRLNAALQEGDILDERGSWRRNFGTREIMRRVNAASEDPRRQQAMLREELARAEREQRGTDANLNSLLRRHPTFRTLTGETHRDEGLLADIGRNVGWLFGVTDALDRAEAQEVGAARSRARDAAARVDVLRDALADLQDRLGAGGPTQTLETPEAAQLRGDVDKLTQSLREQAGAFGLSAEMADLYALRLRGASEAQLAEAGVLADTLEELRHHEQMWERSRKIIEETRTPQEAHTARVDELRDLLEAGYLTQEVYNRGLAASEEELRKQTDTADKLSQKLRSLNNDFSAAAFGSAEALSRIRTHRDNLAADGGPRLSPVSIGAPGLGQPQQAAGSGHRQTQLLGEAVQYLRRIAGQPQVQFQPAGLGGL